MPNENSVKKTILPFLIAIVWGSSLIPVSAQKITAADKKILEIKDIPNNPFNHLMTKNVDDVMDDKSIDIVVETMGGIGAAHEFTKRALSSGKHVVTSNKELVATHGPELMQLAKLTRELNKEVSNLKDEISILRSEID